MIALKSELEISYFKGLVNVIKQHKSNPFNITTKGRECLNNSMNTKQQSIGFLAFLTKERNLGSVNDIIDY